MHQCYQHHVGHDGDDDVVGGDGGGVEGYYQSYGKILSNLGHHHPGVVWNHHY